MVIHLIISGTHQGDDPGRNLLHTRATTATKAFFWWSETKETGFWCNKIQHFLWCVCISGTPPPRFSLKTYLFPFNRTFFLSLSSL